MKPISVSPELIKPRERASETSLAPPSSIFLEWMAMDAESTTETPADEPWIDELKRELSVPLGWAS